MKIFFKGFGEGFKEFSNIIIFIVNSFLLSIVYLVGVGFTSVFAKLIKKTFLDIKGTKKDSYWENLNLKKDSMDQYYRQF